MLVFFGLAFGVLGAMVGHECQRSAATMPPKPFVLHTMILASIVCVALLFFFGGDEGFFVPVFGVAAGFGLLFLWWSVLNRFFDPPLVAIVSGLISLGTTTAYFLG